LADQIGVLGMGAAAITFLALFMHLLVDCIKNDKPFFTIEVLQILVEYLVIAVSLIVMAVPEGLPLAVTISLAYSVLKMKD
jgi:magnesium-transporting ATPase (P-type)